MDILIAFLALDLLIIIHELGHFAVAKWANMKVHEFALFMGPKIFSITRGETTYSLRSLPIGGYVKLEGEETASTDERAFNNKPLWVRALVIFAGPFMNILMAVVVFFILFNVFTYPSNHVDKAIEGSPSYEAGIRDGDKLISYDGRKVYIPTDLYIFLFLSEGETAKALIERDGKEIEVSVEPRTYDKYRYLLGYTPKASYGEDSVVVMKKYENGEEIPPPKDKKLLKNYNKLKDGDKILKLNDEKIEDMDDHMDFTKENKEKPIDVTVLRDGKEVVISLTPLKNEMEREDYDVGLYFDNIKSKNAVEALNSTFIQTYATVRMVGYNLYGLFTGSFGIGDLAGPVGIVSAVGEVIKESRKISFSAMIENFLNITALLSIVIGVSNLIPIPPFDGGKLFLIGLEAVRRKPLKAEFENAIALTGFVILVLLSLVVLFKDVAREINKFISP
ncbi:MAG: RIP metalloprotease RseP [Clostridiales bacterium]